MLSKILSSFFLILFLSPQLHASERHSLTEETSSEKNKKKLYLVVGSKREASVMRYPLLIPITQEDKTDLTHLKTYGGKATTLDIQDSVLKGVNHIKGDARTIDLSDYTLQSVLLERLPTVCERLNPKFNEISQDINHMRKNYLGDCIRNLGKYMPPGAIMEIEWLPQTNLMSSYPPKTLNELLRQNPFHSFFEMNEVLQGIFVLGGDTGNLKQFPEEFSKRIVAMSQKMESLFKFYSSNGVGKSLQHLISTAYWEAQLILRMFYYKSNVLLPYDVTCQDSEKLENAIKAATYTQGRIEVQKYVITKNETTFEIFHYSPQSFMSSSFLNFVLQDLAAGLNQPYVETYLKSLKEFNLISFAKRENSHNNRKNVWMIKLQKR